MYLYDLYLDLKTGQDLSYSEIMAFCDLRGITLKPWEVKILMRMHRTIQEAFLDG